MAVPKITLIKTEAVYGTDANPTAAADAVLTRNRRGTPVQVDQLERNLDLPTRGASPTVPSNERQTINFEVEMAGSGAAGTAPAWMELLRHCGMAAPTIAANVATQKFVGPESEGSSASLAWWQGREKRRMLGARATLGFNATAGAYPFLTLAYTGLLPAAAAFETANPAQADLTRWKQPLQVNTTNTDFSLDGFAAVLRSLTFDIGAEISPDNLVGANGISRGDHAVVGRCVVRAPATETKDYLASLRAGTLLPMLFAHGVAAGARCGLSLPNTQLTSIEEGEQGSHSEWTIGFRGTVVQGADDLIATSS